MSEHDLKIRQSKYIDFEAISSYLRELDQQIRVEALIVFDTIRSLFFNA